MVLIGVTGPMCAGKQTVIDYFIKEHDFCAFSLSDVLRESLTEQGKPVTRDNLIEEGNRLRREQGFGALAKIVLAKALKAWPKSCIIDSIRHPDEVAVFRQNPMFYLMAVDAPALQRFERCIARKREKDPSTLEEFLERDDKEMFGVGGSGTQRVRECMELADTYVVNASSVGDLYEKIIRDNTLSPEKLRPSWDSYFMKLAFLAASRSNCMKRKVGAILTRNKRVVATGYNGTPRGVMNCTDGGCPRCSDTSIPSGTKLDECLCLHAEENAIIEAGRDRAQETSLYTTHFPCLLCAKKIIQAGIAEVVYSNPYALEDMSVKLLEAAGVRTRRHSVDVEHKNVLVL